MPEACPDTLAAPNPITLCGSQQEVVAWLQAHDLKPGEAVKVVLLGDSGVGKSWLCNVMLGAEVFEHANRVASITATVSFACCLGPQKEAIVVCNLPGLKEADSGNLERNKAAVEHMFTEFLPNSPALCLFVTASIHGRIPAENVATMTIIRRYLGASLPGNTFAFIVNAIDYDELDESPAEYAVNVKAAIRTGLGAEQAPQHWAFLPKVPRKARSEYLSGTTHVVREELLELVEAMTPGIVRPAVGTPLRLDVKGLQQVQGEVQAASDEARRRREADPAKHAEEVQRETAEREEAERRHRENAKRKEKLMLVAVNSVLLAGQAAVVGYFCGPQKAAAWAFLQAFSWYFSDRRRDNNRGAC